MPRKNLMLTRREILSKVPPEGRKVIRGGLALVEDLQIEGRKDDERFAYSVLYGIAAILSLYLPLERVCGALETLLESNGTPMPAGAKAYLEERLFASLRSDAEK